MDISINRMRKIIRWLLAKVWIYVFKTERHLPQIIKNGKKKRLFVTTGNISLLNILAIIKQLDEKNCKDVLVIDQGSTKEFFEQNIALAKVHNFKKIITNKLAGLRTSLILSNEFRFDEIFVIYHPIQLPIIKELYPDTPINLFDEGCGSLVKTIDDNLPGLKHFYTGKYIGKIDGWGFSKEVMQKINYINNDIFKNIAKEYSAKFPIETKISKEDKNILFCGVYWTPIEHDKPIFIKEQQELAQKLTDAGYKILYKPHPRATEMYGFENNPNVTVINSRLPMEMYDIDVLAIISSSSSAIMPAHYWDISCFNNINDYHISKDHIHCKHHPEWKINLFRYIVKEYSPSWEELLNFDVKNLSRDELKKQISDFYTNFIKDKPLLSENKKIKEYEEYIEQR